MKKMKAMVRKTKENVQGTNSEAKETGTHLEWKGRSSASQIRSS